MKGNNKHDCASFRTWLYALTRTELLHAMEVDFPSACHEYDLLLEMVQLQPPPPTPIHPRAVGFRPVGSRHGLPVDLADRERLRQSQPRLFQWSIRQSYRPRNSNHKSRTPSPQTRFDMVARKKVTKWGDVLSVGTTREQREADERIVRGSYIRQSPGASPNKVSLNFHEGSFSTCQSIIRVLQVASRGHFLTTSGRSSVPFCTPWLQPTERWFSLSFYLASRYHVALWNAFCAGSFPTTPIQKYEPNVLRIAIPAAVQRALREIIVDDTQSLTLLRDSLTWYAIKEMCPTSMNGRYYNLQQPENWDQIWDSLIHTPLLQSDNREHMRLKGEIIKALEHTLAAEMEKMIMQDPLEGLLLPAKSKSKKKKKRNNAKRGKQRTTRKVSFETDTKEDSSASDKEQQEEAQAAERTQLYSFPVNNVQPQERNRNIVFALGILDDVLENVFTKVGLKATPSSFESSVVVEKGDRKARFASEKQRRSKDSENREVSKMVAHRGPVAQHRAEDKSLKKPGPVGKPPKKGRTAITAPGKQPIGAATGKQPQRKNDTFPMFQISGQTEGAMPAPAPGPTPFDVDWSIGASFEDQSNYRPMFLTDENSNAMPEGFHKPLNTDIFPFVTANENHLSPLDQWPFLSRYQARDQSILTDFFETQEEKIDEDEKLMAASTAASISSSTYKDAMVVVDVDDMDKVDEEEPVPPVAIVGEIENLNLEVPTVSELGDDTEGATITLDCPNHDLVGGDFIEGGTRIGSDGTDGAELQSNEDTIDTAPECRSPSPQAPLTPPPTLSPILVSLADLKTLKKTTTLTPKPAKLAKSKSERAKRSSSMVGLPGSLPNSPVPPQKNGLTPSWSREDLRIASFKDDSGIKSKRPQMRPIPPEQQQTYKAAAVKSLAKPIASSKGANFDFRSTLMETPASRRQPQRESCAQSETALDGHGDEQQWQPETRKQAQDDTDNKSATKDETTTITSALSHREPEEHGSIRDERNSFRDMCLTLGAEVSKLKAMLSAQKASSVVAVVDFQDNMRHPVHNPGPFDPYGMQPFFHGIQRGQRLGAMSDAGVHRGGDHESQVSEDGVYSEVFSKARVDAVTRMSSSATVLGSDASIENNGSTGPGVTLGALPVYDSVTVHGLQSRLTKDILRFLNATSQQLRKQDAKRRMAVERFSRLVNTIWPRAQVKLYGSHVSGLCLPSSDLDFVICLPAVHKNAPALAPGVLEGRNAINETSQKLLARELKGESWVDPRSIKLIDRTVVPVIKVSTKDTRARMLQLDISFDSPEHHGLQANQMVAQILEELPLIRPLMLVLKQFLLDRGLLTSYTGGLSSYCLFLMVARYLQEQSPICLDCGSLLMGFLDFHGNHFDPRATGISVYRRQYFARPNYAVATYEATEQSMWFPLNQHHVVPNSPAQGPHDFRRRNSFSDTGSVDGNRRNQTPLSHQWPPRYPPARFVPTAHSVEHGNPGRSVDHGRPYTFDPLCVEDPLYAGNNVGRNAFRIFQVQRAFSDAHRALVASLEWDIHSSGDLNDADYPLLKCLLHSEDVLYEL